MTPQTYKKLAVALAISVAVNLFIGGMIASAWLVQRPPGGFRAAGPLMMGQELAARDETARPAFAAVRDRHKRDIRRSFKSVQKARRAAHRALVAEDFDPAAFEAALAEVRSRTAGAQRALHAAFAELAANLSAAQRRRLAEGMRRRRPILHEAPPPGGGPGERPFMERPAPGPPPVPPPEG